MIQPVTRDRSNESEIILMDMTDVLYIQIEDGAVVFYTENDRYYPLVPSLSTYAKHTEKIGFQRLDRTNLVNMSKIRSLDEKRGLVFFDDEAGPDSLCATVAFVNLSKLKKIIRQWIENNTSE